MKVSAKKAFNKKRILALFIIFILIGVMVLSNPEVWQFFLENKTVKLNFQSGVEYDAIAYGKDVLLVNNEGIYAIDKSGRQVWSNIAPSTSPYAETKGDYIMLGDINGRTVKTFQKEKLVTQIETKNEILCAKVNKNGYIAVATDELGYKGMVILYNKSGDELYRWHSGTGYIGDIDISKKNKIIVAQLMTDKESVYSKIISINPSLKEDPKTIAEIEGIVMKLRFRDDGSFVAVSDNAIYGFKRSGKESFVTDFEGRKLLECNIENDSNMVLAFASGLNSTVLESYSSKGKKRGSFDCESEINALDVSGECIVVARHGSILRISPNGTLKKEIKINNDVKDIQIYSNRNMLLSIGGGSAELIKIR